ncbi:HPP family protein [Bdellovibrio sp. HCB288]|uniref:CBS domain-containing protein n=1 Tax=Bdellovibrio sp. HCB288 TaxID=3394355 RepID=UPI0039B63DD2
MAKLARDVMTNDVIMIAVGSSLAEAQSLMKEHGIRHLPVVDQDQRIVGILSNSDLSFFKDSKMYPVEDFMSQPVQTMNQSASLMDAIDTMLEKKISSVLVVNDDEELVGIVTTDDLIQVLGQALRKDSHKRPLSTLFDIESLDEIAYKISQTGI